MSHKNSDFVEFMHFSCRTRTFITILASYFCRCCIRQASLIMISWFNQFILFFLQKIVCESFVFCSSWSLKSVKSTWFKICISESNVRFKKTDNQCRNLNWKIRSVRERKCSGNINSLSGYQYRIFYLHFGKVTKCECFGRIEEPGCYTGTLLKFQFIQVLFYWQSPQWKFEFTGQNQILEFIFL